MERLVDRWRQNAADRAKALLPMEVRRGLLKARLGMRRGTSRWRTLPDVLILGGQRCGTSSLYKWLGRHPNTVPSLRKEIEYFSIDHGRGDDWYRVHFPLVLRRRAAGALGRPFLTFEATPDYLFDPRAPQRAGALVPDAKLIALLRDPAARAVSQYHHNVRLGHEPLELEEALRAEDQRLDDQWGRIVEDPDDRAVMLRRFSYVARGRYAEQLERWLAVFPRQQLLVLRSEDLFARPGETFERIVAFLGLPAWQPPEFRNYSYIDALDGNYPDPPDRVHQFLADRLAEPNARLARLLGEEYRWDVGGSPQGPPP